MNKTTDLVIDCYYNGIFPMSHGRDVAGIYFVNPNKRGIIPLNKVHISRSLKRSINKQDFIITNDKLILAKLIKAILFVILFN